MQSKVLNRRNSKKGFTLMEMLIVVAIIAILVAIAIPTFTTQLEKARVAADSANIRAAYAMVQTCNLLETDPKGDAESNASATWYLNKDGSFATSDDSAYVCQAKNGTSPQASWDKDDKIKVIFASGEWSLSVS